MEKFKYRDKRVLALTTGCFIVGFITCYLLIGLYIRQPINDNIISSSTSIPQPVVQQTSVEVAAQRDLVVDATKERLKIELQSSYSAFEKTIKSCLGDSCFDEKVQYPSGQKFHRIGILAPLRSGGEAIVNILTQTISASDSKQNKNIVVLYDTNVPAYG